jgi:hypothetical protein
MTPADIAAFIAENVGPDYVAKDATEHQVDAD